MTACENTDHGFKDRFWSAVAGGDSTPAVDPELPDATGRDNEKADYFKGSSGR
jgi:hypothetical protein